MGKPMHFTRMSIFAVLLAATPLNTLGVASAQTGPATATTGVGSAPPTYNAIRPSLAGEVIPSPRDTAAHNAAISERDRQPIAANTFNFTDEQKQQIRDALAAEKGMTANVTLAAGTEAPANLPVKPVPERLAQEIPGLTPYNFAKIGDKIAIIDPHLPVVVAVIE
jgi:hypothetical protein